MMIITIIHYIGNGTDGNININYIIIINTKLRTAEFIGIIILTMLVR